MADFNLKLSHRFQEPVRRLMGETKERKYIVVIKPKEERLNVWKDKE